MAQKKDSVEIIAKGLKKLKGWGVMSKGATDPGCDRLRLNIADGKGGKRFPGRLPGYIPLMGDPMTRKS